MSRTPIAVPASNNFISLAELVGDKLEFLLDAQSEIVTGFSQLLKLYKKLQDSNPQLYQRQISVMTGQIISITKSLPMLLEALEEEDKAIINAAYNKAPNGILMLQNVEYKAEQTKPLYLLKKLLSAVRRKDQEKTIKLIRQFNRAQYLWVLDGSNLKDIYQRLSENVQQDDDFRTIEKVVLNTADRLLVDNFLFDLEDQIASTKEKVETYNTQNQSYEFELEIAPAIFKQLQSSENRDAVYQIAIENIRNYDAVSAKGFRKHHSPKVTALEAFNTSLQERAEQLDLELTFTDFEALKKEADPSTARRVKARNIIQSIDNRNRFVKSVFDAVKKSILEYQNGLRVFSSSKENFGTYTDGIFGFKAEKGPDGKYTGKGSFQDNDLDDLLNQYDITQVYADILTIFTRLGSRDSISNLQKILESNLGQCGLRFTKDSQGHVTEIKSEKDALLEIVREVYQEYHEDSDGIAKGIFSFDKEKEEAEQDQRAMTKDTILAEIASIFTTGIQSPEEYDKNLFLQVLGDALAGAGYSVIATPAGTEIVHLHEKEKSREQLYREVYSFYEQVTGNNPNSPSQHYSTALSEASTNIEKMYQKIISIKDSDNEAFLQNAFEFINHIENTIEEQNIPQLILDKLTQTKASLENEIRAISRLSLLDELNEIAQDVVASGDLAKKEKREYRNELQKRILAHIQNSESNFTINELLDVFEEISKKVDTENPISLAAIIQKKDTSGNKYGQTNTLNYVIELLKDEVLKKLGEQQLTNFQNTGQLSPELKEHHTRLQKLLSTKTVPFKHRLRAWHSHPFLGSKRGEKYKTYKRRQKMFFDGMQKLGQNQQRAESQRKLEADIAADIQRQQSEPLEKQIAEIRRKIEEARRLLSEYQKLLTTHDKEHNILTRNFGDAGKRRKHYEDKIEQNTSTIRTLNEELKGLRITLYKISPRIYTENQVDPAKLTSSRRRIR